MADAPRPAEPARGDAGPSLTRLDSVAEPVAVALLLHGGQERSHAAVSARTMSWQRGAALGRTLARRLRDRRVAVALLRYREVGWNGDGADRIADARWATGRLREQLAGLPLVLVGHSMGGRTACHVADDPQAHGVVALAPWLPRDESVEALAGKELHAAHGRFDRITSARDTRAYVERAAVVAAATSFTDMGERGHYLLRGVHAWNGFTADRVRRVLGLD